MSVLWLVAWFPACKEPEAPPIDTEPEEEPPPPPDTQTEIPVETAFTGITGITGDTAVDPCAELPPLPVSYDVMNNFHTAEDFDFDADGYLCTIDNGNLACWDQQSNFKLVGANVVLGSAGTRVLPTGDWVVADTSAGSIVRVDVATGQATTLVSGLLYPNGVEVDADNMVYVAENSGARVRQIDAYTGEQWLVANGLAQPNGVILSPDGNTMYVGSFGGGVIYAIDRLGPTDWDDPRILFNPPVPDGGFDGINVDVCGNVYITEYTKGRVYRITPDGLSAEMVVDFQAFWIPNMRWGHDIGGWESDILYVSAWDRLYAMHMGIEGKKHVSMQ